MALGFAGCSNRQASDTPESAPASIIFDTDFGPDYDDAGAITILHALQQQGEANVLATIASNRFEGIAATLDAFNTFWANPDLPIGVPGAEAVEIPDHQHWTDSIRANYPHKITSNSEVPSSVDVYRKVLAQQPDSSVTIVTVGFLTNLPQLLKSGPDTFSGLNGIELVKKKVKLLVSMAGNFPKGKEYNLLTDVEASKFTFENWPTKVIFSGFEIGDSIKTGLPLLNASNEIKNPVNDVFRICIPMAPSDSTGRMSWDEVTTLVAVRGSEPYFNLQEGHIIVHPDGSNSWDENGHGQFYLKQNVPPRQMEKLINKLMETQPRKNN